VASTCAGLVATPMLVLTLLLTPSGARSPQPLPPLLGGTWFPVHVVTTCVGYGGLLLAGSAGLLRLVAGRSAETPGIPAQLDRVAYGALVWGYPWLTCGMLAGAIWSWESWGVVWSWNSKEVLTLVTWGLYTLCFHTRRLRGWQGRAHSGLLGLGLLALLLALFLAQPLARQVVPGVEYVF
ncbi:MAG: cytochrome c biogenesis protein CcsA, partial [Chloroflexia bacterium]